MIDLKAELKKNPFVLAPMAGITDKPFRSYMREMGCGAVITELVSANGLQFNSEKTIKIMQFDQIQHPVGIQLFGETPEVIAEGAKKAQEMGADFVDMNFGCPVPKVVKKGAGSAVLKDLKELSKILKAVKSAVEIPVTVKIRTGWDHNSKNSVEVAQVAYDEGIEWVAIHGRTRSQGYSGLADWDYIADVKAKSKLPILGNGDITSAPIAIQKLKESGCDGVMIGRGCLKNPWIFQESLALYQGSKSLVHRDYQHAINRLIHYLTQTSDDRLIALQTKKLAAWYSAGYPGSAKFRQEIFQFKEKEMVIDKVKEFFSGVEHLPQPDTSHESFLMGGHG